MDKKDLKKSIRIELMRNKIEMMDLKWIFQITLLAFLISIIFSLLSESFIPKASIIISILVLIIFILIGIIFDMIGVAVQNASEVPFHSMNSRKIKGAKMAIKLKKNADKTSTFCNDVIGDICGIISGTTGSIIAIKLALKFELDEFWFILTITGLISALTIGGKAIGKSVAINRSNYILYNFSKFITNFVKKK